MLLDAGDEIYQQATVRNRPGEKEDDDVKMISAVQQVDIINDVSIVQCCDGHSRISNDRRYHQLCNIPLYTSLAV